MRFSAHLELLNTNSTTTCEGVFLSSLSYVKHLHISPMRTLWAKVVVKAITGWPQMYYGTACRLRNINNIDRQNSLLRLEVTSRSSNLTIYDTCVLAIGSTIQNSWNNDPSYIPPLHRVKCSTVCGFMNSHTYSVTIRMDRNVMCRFWRKPGNEIFWKTSTSG